MGRALGFGPGDPQFEKSRDGVKFYFFSSRGLGKLYRRTRSYALKKFPSIQCKDEISPPPHTVLKKACGENQNGVYGNENVPSTRRGKQGLRKAGLKKREYKNLG
ncbi:MAG: hypothetical protein CM15mP51_23340 [Porticoccaceae bacterium]|nr:MAG: hypothetical protein CM15mP51_23340 [Porticoccaceae bacterium]